MEEDRKELPAPPRRFRYKGFKFLTVTLFFLTLFFVLGFSGLEATSSSKFCSSCHEMEPEYYTWKSSTHSEVECSNCHIGSGVENISKAKANGLVQVYRTATDNFTAPIQMPKNIPNSACEKCHNMKTREVTASGDLIIPHDKHLAKDIKCTECHSGVAHGKVAERNVTFKSDYSKWDDTLGKSMMSDVKYTSPKMETCMECHKVRNVSTACKTCHKTGMEPKSHKQANFKTGNHGKIAEKDIKNCNKCHGYMSDDEIKGLEDKHASQEFLRTGTISQESSITAQEYGKENTFCQKCHSQRPPSHVKGFVNLHGPLAKSDQQKCLTCHYTQNTGQKSISNVYCNSCHPAQHKDKNWRAKHPIAVSNNEKISNKCYTCHVKNRCSACHKE